MSSLQQLSSISKLLASCNHQKSDVYAHHIHSLRNEWDRTGDSGEIRVTTKTHEEHVNGSVEVLVVIPFRSRLKTSQPLEALWRAICEREFLNSSAVVVPVVVPAVVPVVVPVVSTRVGRF